jgi:hypothetical protein
MGASTASGSALTVREYAARLGVSVPVILGYIRSGDLAAIDVSSKPGIGRPTWRIPESAIVDFILRRSSRGPAAKGSQRRSRRKDPEFVNYF